MDKNQLKDGDKDWDSCGDKDKGKGNEDAKEAFFLPVGCQLPAYFWFTTVSSFSLFSRVHATLQVTSSVCRSVGLSVGLSHFAFFAFLGYLQVGKHTFEYLVEL